MSKRSSSSSSSSYYFVRSSVVELYKTLKDWFLVIGLFIDASSKAS
jgi:hypothetical protein